MDAIAEALFEALSDANTEQLAKVMTAFETTRCRSLQDCRHLPAFRKLWDAMDEACRYHNDR